jgi:hypothetical protein
MVSETRRNGGDTGDARRKAHNPAMTGRGLWLQESYEIP